MLTLADLLDRGARNPAPGPRGHPLLGSLPEVRRDPIRLFLESFQRYGDVVRFHFGPMIAHLVSSPAGANHVLAENNKNYGKQTRGYRNLRYVLGNGLLTSEGETWKRQRRIAQPAFPTRENRKFRRALATLDSVVLRMIAERRKDPADRGDLLSMLIEARDAETGESMDDR